MVFRIIFFSLLLLACHVNGSVFESDAWNSRIINLKLLEKTELKDSVEAMFKALNGCADKSLKQKQAKKIFAQTLPKGGEAHIHSLVYLADYSPYASFETRLEYLNEAESLSRTLKKPFCLAWTYDAKSVLYGLYGKYDLSMLNILKARDIYIKLKAFDYLEVVNHRIADLYCAAGLLDKAEKAYLDILQQEKHADGFEAWRHFVLLNSLGCIALERENYDTAMYYFKKSSALREGRSLSVGDSLGLAYAYGLLCETSIKKGDFENAKDYYNRGIDVLEREKYKDFLAYFYALKSRILYNNGDVDGALKFIVKVLRIAEDKSVSFRSENTFYKWAATLYEEKGDVEQSLAFIKKYGVINESRIQQKNRTQALLILAEKEYESVQARYREIDLKYRLLLMSFIIFATGSIAVFLLYTKLRHSNKKLVQKALDTAPVKPHVKPDHSEGTSEWIKLNRLIDRLDKVMQQKKLYLNPEFSIQDAAHELQTNRTYLSKAINTVLQENFINYINAFRVAAGIKFMQSEEAKKYDMNAIANKAGFKSRSVFSEVFKKHTGVSPSFFIKNLPKHPPADL